jgi:signal transduction histidine kinase
MVRMIDQILDFTRARIGGGLLIEPAAVDLQELATEILAEFETAASHQMVLETSGDAHGEWDRDRLAQVISNLLGNAVEHGDPARPIRLRVDGTESDVVRIAVQSGGVIPGEVLPNLFDPFRAVTSTHKARKSKGLGLGLYIVQQIVEAHGGDIDVRTNREESTTTFFVSIPRKAFRSSLVRSRQPGAWRGARTRP